MRSVSPVAALIACAILTCACNSILGIGDVTGPGDGDAGIDATETAPAAPKPRSPRMGAATGSVHASKSLRPRFAWRASAGATRYELVVDDSCPATSFQTCVFPSPEISKTDLATATYVPDADLAVARSIPVGRRYYWRVRACNEIGCGDWSDTWYLNVGRLDDDVNGDGYGDLVVGIKATVDAPTQVGSAYIVFGNATATTASIATLLDPENHVDGRFGSAVAMIGDINADGYGEVAVGAWKAQQTAHNGFVYVYLGRGTWPASVNAASAGFGLADGAPADFYGASIAGRGDVNGDGYGDFAMAAVDREAPSSPGYAYVSFGRAIVAGTRLGADLIIPDPDGGPTSAFGYSLSLGDLNQDGLTDVIIGAPGAAAFAGTVAAYFGRSDFSPIPFTLVDPDVRVTAPIVGPALFGWSTGLCTSSGSLSALAVGSPQESSPGSAAGAVRIYGGHEPWPLSVDTPDRTLSDPSQILRDLMGLALACADVAADNSDDLIAAAPTGDDAGTVYIFSDAASSPTVPVSTLTDATSGGLGYDLAATDFNGDGVEDVFAAKPRASVGAGAVVGWLGRGTWPATISTADITIVKPAGVAGERFGESLD